MSRTVIAVVAAAVIAVLTLTTFLVTRNAEAARGRSDARAFIRRSTGLLGRTAALESLSIQKRVEALAADPGFVAALKATANAERATQAGLAFGRFKAGEKSDRGPDILAIVNATGDILAMDGVTGVVPGEWKTDGKLMWPAVSAALGQRIIISEIWDYPRQGLMKVGVAPIVDPDAVAETGGLKIIGAVVIAYAITSTQARETHEELGSEVAYFYGDKMSVTSFRRGNDEDTAIQPKLLAAMKASGLAPGSGQVKELTVDGVTYLAAAVRIPRYMSKDAPPGYPESTEGALVLQPTAAAAASQTALTFILLLGVGSIVIAMLAMYLSNRRIIGQVDQVELGVADIINGNVDRTFKPVGKELDGLANGLNVMLARLLGRPEPGEEELDDDGNPIVVGRVEFDEQEPDAAPQATDPDLAQLAEEAEPDYYKRVYTEYRDARKSIGSPDEVSFENFIAKLKMNEGKLKAQYQCRAVRFRVVTKDGKVSLKPVPIFA